MVAIALACAQPKPKFSGTWKLNTAESDYTDKRLSFPDSLVWTLEQKGEHLKYTVAGVRQGKNNGFTADVQIGEEPFESNEAGIITAKWKGASLIVDTLYNPQNERRSSMEEIWTLSEDGKKLTDKVVYHVPKTAKNPADIEFKRVFDKQ